MRFVRDEVRERSISIEGERERERRRGREGEKEWRWGRGGRKKRRRGGRRGGFDEIEDFRVISEGLSGVYLTAWATRLSAPPREKVAWHVPFGLLLIGAARRDQRILTAARDRGRPLRHSVRFSYFYHTFLFFLLTHARRHRDRHQGRTRWTINCDTVKVMLIV